MATIGRQDGVSASVVGPEVDFATGEIGEVARLFMEHGYVLLRRFWDPAVLESMKADVRRLDDEVNEYHLYPKHYADRGVALPHCALLAGRARMLLDAIFSGVRYWPYGDSCVSRHISTARVAAPGWMPPFQPHIDACVMDYAFAVNFWTPLQPCGVDLPSLGIVTAGFDEAVEFVGYREERVWHPPEGWDQFGCFDPRMLAMCANDPAALAAFWEHFAGRAWTPAYEFGDAMLLSNWTLHFTHATGMTGRRENLELRFMSEASLPQMLESFRTRRQ